MKHIITVILLIAAITMSLSAQKLNQEYTDKKDKKHLIGQCNRDGFSAEPYSKWFTTNYDMYNVDKVTLKRCKRKIKNVKVQIFMGTWCGDSRKEVPRFYKMLDELGFDEEDVELINLNNSRDHNYKKSPTHEERGKFIHRVPTFIVYKKGEEIGRIVEAPVTSLEMDFTQILNELPSAPSYQIVTRTHELLNTSTIPTDRKEVLEIARAVQHLRLSKHTLNSYGYLLMWHNEIDKAIAVLTINSMLYAKEPNVYDSLAEAYEKKGNLKSALVNYEYVLKLDPKNEHALKKVKELKEK